jgi:exonuclease V gamma subunit
MSLHLYRHQKVELLDAALAANLVRTRPRDPLASIALVVGSRGMERHLRHSLATASGVAMQLEFLFPEHAFRTAAAALLDDAREIPWKASEVTADVWRGPALVFRVVEALRHLRTSPDFAAVAAYLGDSGAVVGPRELRFA